MRLRVLTLFLAGSLCFRPWGAASSAAETLVEPAAAAAEFEQHTWLRENGLPDDYVQALLQTADGYLWIGTLRGLARFDGVRFVIFDHVNTPELTSDNCRSLAQDSEGNIWVGTRQGIVRVTGNRFVRVSNEEFSQRDTDPVLCASDSGHVWAGGNGSFKLLNQAVARTNRIQLRNVERQPWVFGIDEERTGALWLATHAGLVRFDPRTQFAELAPLHQEFEKMPMRAILRDSQGKRWVLVTEPGPEATFHGEKAWVVCFQNDHWLKVPNLERLGFVPNPQSGLFLVEDTLGALWFPSGANSVNRLVNNEFQHLPIVHKPETDVVRSACADREGNLWFGTTATGLQHWARRKVRVLSKKEGLTDENVWAIYQTRDGAVLVGTEGGLNRFQNGQVKPVPTSEGPLENRIRSVTQDATGTIWVGTMRTLFRLNGTTSEQVSLPDEWENKIRVLLPARDGALWIGSIRGLTRLQNGHRTRFGKAQGLSGEDVRALLEDRAGNLWIGTFGGGLSCWQAGKMTTLTAADGLSNNNVWALHEDSEGVLWVGTERGLNRIDHGVITVFTSAQGLPDNGVNWILEDDFGRLWIGHDHGIYWVRKQDFAQVTARRRNYVNAVSYDESDGLVSLETNGQKSSPAAYKTLDGRLWFATTKGVAIFDPAQVGPEELAPVSVVEQIRSNGETIFDNGPATGGSPSEILAAGTRSGDSVIPRQSVHRLPQGQPIRHAQSVLWELPPGRARVLEFRYTANAFVAPERTQFRYRLHGLDDHWISAGARREVSFTDLRPGEYAFEVMARNHHGVWPEHGTAVRFQLLPYYYQTWWFYVLLGTTLLGLGMLVYRWRVAEVRKIHQLEQMNALNEQRKQIARDIHDELGASLTHIVQLSNEARKNAAHPEKLKIQTELISDVAEKAVDHISEILWASNPEFDTLEDLVTYLREYAATLFQSSSITIHFKFPETVPRGKVSGLFRRHLLLLVKEALQNIMKHAEAREVRLDLILDEATLQLSISDNGRGLPSNTSVKTGNGINNMRQRLSELNGTLELTSASGGGTQVRFRIPMSGD